MTSLQAHAEIEYLHRLCSHVPDYVANSMTPHRSLLASPIPFAPQHHHQQPMHLPIRRHVPPKPHCSQVSTAAARLQEQQPKYHLNSRGSSINSTSFHLKHTSESGTTGSNSSLSKRSRNQAVIHESESEHLVSDANVRGTSL